MSMSNSVHYVRKQVNTKSLLGRPARIEMLQEKDQPTDKLQMANDELERAQMQNKPTKGFSFNNNIYNNYNPNHIIEAISPARRLLPKMDQQRIDMIKRLQQSGKIKSTGRSPVPLQLYDTADPVDHLYITSVTKHVPVAHDSQLQRENHMSPSSPGQKKVMSASNATRFYGSSVGAQSKLDGRDSLFSPKLVAQHELQQVLNKGYTIAQNQNLSSKLESGLQRSIEDLRKDASSAYRKVGEVSVTLPPGFGLKKPSAAQSRKNQISSFAQMMPTENTHAMSSMDQQPTTAFVSGHTLHNQQNMDSLFQDQSYDHSLFDPHAFSLGSPQHGTSHPPQPPMQMQQTANQTHFHSTAPFRSMVSPKTHQEIADLLRQANPAVYEEHARRKAEIDSERKRSASRAFNERRDTIQQALIHNTWHAPVKKQQILQSVLDGTDEPLEGEIDQAIVAHGIRKFGTERSAHMESHGEALDSKKFGNSTRKERELRQMQFMRNQDASKEHNLSKSDLDLAGNTAGSGLIIQTLIKNNQSSVSNSVDTQEQQSKSHLYQGSSQDQHVPSSDRLDLSADVHDSSRHASPHVGSFKNSSAVASMLIKDKMQVKAPKDMDDSKVHKTIESESAVDSPSYQAPSQQRSMMNAVSQPSGLDSVMRKQLPPITTSKLDNSAAGISMVESQLPPGKLKPTFLAKRREKKNQMNRKQSTSYMGSLHRSSKMSNTMGPAAAMSMPTSVSKGKSQVEEDAAENVDRILVLLDQLKELERQKKGSSSMEVDDDRSTPMFDAAKKPTNAKIQVSSQAILDLPVNGSFDQKKKRSPKASKKRKRRGSKASPERQAPDFIAMNAMGAGASARNRAATAGKDAKKNEDLKAAAAHEDATTFQRPLSPGAQGKALERRREMEKMQEAVDKNQSIIRELLIQLAQTLQRPDSEQRHLRNNVLMPHNLSKYNLRRYVCKTIQLNVGSLYQPLKFRFDDIIGNFKVYFSHKTKLPGEDNGYEQMATKQQTVIFPIAQEHMAPNMLRYPKDKVLYITMESDQDCSPAVSVTHNKKEAQEIAVASVAASHSQKGSGILDVPRRMSMDQLSTGSSERKRATFQAPVMSEEELEQQAQMTMETLALMLGGDDNTQHASKLNQLVKKKISYMINDDIDVAKDFLNLVDILKQHKSSLKKVIRDTIMTNKRSQEFNMRNSQEMLELNQQRLSPTAGAIPDIAIIDNTQLDVSHGYQHHIFSTDLYRLFKEGHLSKQQYNEMRQEQQKQKKKEIDAVNRVHALQAITKKEHRKELQTLIVENLNKQAADTEFVRRWRTMMVIQRMAQRQYDNYHKKKAEVAFLAKVFWTVVKIKINLSIKLKRWGRTPEERIRRQMKMALQSIGSAVHLRDMTAGKVIVSSFQWLRTVTDLKKCIKENGLQVRKIQERFRAYWQVRTAQINMIVTMMNREKDRLIVSMIKNEDQTLRYVATLCTKLNDENILKVATAYYQACQFLYEPVFFAWRKKTQELRDAGYEDMTSGYHMPYMHPRGIKNMQEINYSVTYKRLSLQKYLEKASKTCRSRFQYFMNVDEDDRNSQTHDGDSHSASNRTMARRAGRASGLTSRKSTNKMRRNNPNFATLEDAIAKQEEKFKGEILKDLKNAAYYPSRPAMKFIPTAKMTHQLIHQAIMIQSKNLEAPAAWRDAYDLPLPSSKGSVSGYGSQSNPRTAVSKTSQPFKVITEHSRLHSNVVNVQDAANMEVASDLPIGQQINPDMTGGQAIQSDDGKMLSLGGIRQPSRLPSRASMRRNDDDDQDMNARDTTPEPFIRKHDSLHEEAYMRQRTHATAEDDPVGFEAAVLNSAMDSDDEGRSPRQPIQIMDADGMKSELD